MREAILYSSDVLYSHSFLNFQEYSCVAKYLAASFMGYQNFCRISRSSSHNVQRKSAL